MQLSANAIRCRQPNKQTNDIQNGRLSLSQKSSPHRRCMLISSAVPSSNSRLGRLVALYFLSQRMKVVNSRYTFRYNPQQKVSGWLAMSKLNPTHSVEHKASITLTNEVKIARSIHEFFAFDRHSAAAAWSPLQPTDSQTPVKKARADTFVSLLYRPSSANPTRSQLSLGLRLAGRAEGQVHDEILHPSPAATRTQDEVEDFPQSQ